jgi:hypothetical protein
LTTLGAGGELERAQLLGPGGGPLERIVLLLGLQVPGDHHELARDGDGGDVRAASGGGALPERAQRPGAACRDPRGLDEHRAHRAWAMLGDRAVLGWL